MNSDDRVLSAVAARNPVPDPDQLTAEQRAAGERIRSEIVEAAPPRRPRVGSAWHARPRVRHGLLIACGIVPVVVIVALALGTKGARHGRIPATGGAAGAPQTLLLIGSDHRAGEPYRVANTDTMLLVRVSAQSRVVNLLSVPRDLEVRLPLAGTTITGKLNSAYSIGGPHLLLRVLGTQVLPGLHVDHVIDLNFAGFSDVIDALGCVYADVDHRYYNNTALTDYSSINIQPGYQKLCGENQSDTGALAFVRYRHTDSDLVREARLADLLRWIAADLAAADPPPSLEHLLVAFAGHVTVDNGLHSAGALASEGTLLIHALHDQLRSIPFPAQLAPCDSGGTPCYVRASPRAKSLAFDAFMDLTPGGAPARPPATETPPTAGAHLVDGSAGGQRQAAALGRPGLPVYYPGLIAHGSTYCSSAAGNCDTPQEPGDAFAGAYPRAYEIAANGRAYPAYRMTLVINPSLGEFYGVQGTTWHDPPILARPTRTQTVGGRRLLEYDEGSRLTLVAWRTPSAVYWVSNTLTGTIPAGQLIAIAASLRPAS